MMTLLITGNMDCTRRQHYRGEAAGIEAVPIKVCQQDVAGDLPHALPREDAEGLEVQSLRVTHRALQATHDLRRGHARGLK